MVLTEYQMIYKLMFFFEVNVRVESFQLEKSYIQNVILNQVKNI